MQPHHAINLVNAIALCVAAILGGTLNAVAGGGSFITFPTLIFAGVQPIQANATSTVALWPGSVASVGAYRDAITTPRRTMLMLGVTSVVGGALGALLLIHTKQSTFERLIPYLLLAATVLFAFGNAAVTRMRRGVGKRSVRPWVAMAGLNALQFIIAIYGGFFGGGIGILMLAAFSVLNLGDINNMNAVKAWLASCINGIAIVLFVVAGKVEWLPAAIMILGAIIGGYGGASVARRLDPQLVRTFVIVVGFVMTAYFFIHGA